MLKKLLISFIVVASMGNVLAMNKKAKKEDVKNFDVFKQGLAIYKIYGKCVLKMLQTTDTQTKLYSFLRGPSPFNPTTSGFYISVGDKTHVLHSIWGNSVIMEYPADASLGSLFKDLNKKLGLKKEAILQDRTCFAVTELDGGLVTKLDTLDSPVQSRDIMNWYENKISFEESLEKKDNKE